MRADTVWLAREKQNNSGFLFLFGYDRPEYCTPLGKQSRVNAEKDAEAE